MKTQAQVERELDSLVQFCLNCFFYVTRAKPKNTLLRFYDKDFAKQGRSMNVYQLQLGSVGKFEGKDQNE